MILIAKYIGNQETLNGGYVKLYNVYNISGFISGTTVTHKTLIGALIYKHYGVKG